MDMSIHINARPGEIAPTVLLPGDPLRAKYIAEKFLEGASVHNEVRHMLGYTGTYKGMRVSVQGTGMGIPSMSIYAQELMESYSVENLIRVGTCGAIQDFIRVRDLVLAMSASTDSAVNRVRFGGIDYAPTANFDLLKRAYEMASAAGIKAHVGSVFTSDTFYNDNKRAIELWAAHGVLALEMETAALYTLAARFGRKALSVLTVSDHVLTGEATSSLERETTFDQMVEVALETGLKL